MMRRAPQNSLLALLLLLPPGARAETGPPGVPGHSLNPGDVRALNPGDVRALNLGDVRAAERARAAELATQKAAATRAAKAKAEEQRLADKRIAAADRLRETEAATAAVATRMDALATRRREAEARLAKRAEAMQPLLPLMQRLTLFPAETLLAVPASPEDSLRGVLVLQGLARQLETEAKALRQDQAALDAATAALAAETPKLAAAIAAQAERAALVDRMIAATQARRRDAETEADAAAKRAAAEAGRADTLRAALIALEAERTAAVARAHEETLRAERRKHAVETEAARRREAALARPTGSMSGSKQPRGQLLTPVVGAVIRAFGEATESGPATGVSYQAPPAARVIAPCSGRVAFADRFRTYGQLLIIDCGGGYHAVLSGLDRLDVHVGQTLRAGEPLGVMPVWEPGTTGRRPSLYVELRHDGQPVNPAPWLRGTG